MKLSAPTTILRWGLAFVFFYAGMAALMAPEAWVGFLPAFLTAALPAKAVLTVFSVYEILLAGFLFWGKRLVWSSALATATLGGIVLADWSIMDIVFRDVGLAFAALALFEMAKHDTMASHDAVQ